ncbi:uncharacterized protein K02A2.6-like [Zingiber officinale]|uniref:uncharacterized protein K02A2.6-like n=1 Tax=Zingiber officinale TaxID=94328 RepID=UPI001C4DACEF|nr:uncharacterized protein K02A2.6-like [Zingiber officinale]
MVIKFVWQNILYRFGIPRRLVSYNGRQFADRRFKKLCKGYGIQETITSVAYPQSNDQAEVTNQEIIRGLRAQVDHAGGSWVNELPSVLWALRMTPKEVTDVMPFHLVYDGEALVPMEVKVKSDRVQHYDEENDEWRLMDLDLVDKARDKAVVRLMAY